MKYVKIKEIEYEFISNFRDNKTHRNSFNLLATATFGLSFEFWFEEGFWADNYIPYSLIHDGKIVSNVSVNVIQFLFEGEKKTGLQIGTVMTDINYRKKGLNKFLLDMVIEEWKEKVDFIYLFANDSVLNFYPKFNFITADEFQYSKKIKNPNITSLAKKLNIADPKDKALLINTIKNALPISRVSMVNNISLIMFYCLSFKKESIYYLDELNVIAIADFADKTLIINDIFSTSEVNINEVINALAYEKINKVKLDFTPLNTDGFERDLFKEEGTTLFILKDQINFFMNKDWMFPVLSHA